MRHRLAVTAAAVLLSSAGTLHAQVTSSPSAQAGFIAIVVTPVGALPEVVVAQRTLDSSSRAAVAVRFGRYNFKNGPTFNNLGLSGMLRFGRRVSASATVGQRTCDVCEGLKMAAVDLSALLYHKEASGDIGGDTDIGLRISGGYGKADSSDISARSFAVGLPFAISLPQPENSFLTMFVTPAMAYGSLTTNGVADGAPRFMFSAGLGYTFAFGLGVHASAHRIAIEESPTQFGLAMSWRFGGRT